LRGQAPSCRGLVIPMPILNQFPRGPWRPR
jgi:hypothetical protein